MRKLSVFESISLDGYFSDGTPDASWAHRASDPELDAYVASSANSNGALVFGRKTYEIMASFWPTPAAAQLFPEVARGMNASPKYVFSRTVTASAWPNTRIINSDPIAAIRELKAETGPTLVVLGSGSIVSQLVQAGLVDEIQLMLVPVVLGHGHALFDGVTATPHLVLAKHRAFPSGNVALTYDVLV
jgi:dihydrofolate reductase